MIHCNELQWAETHCALFAPQCSCPCNFSLLYENISEKQSIQLLDLVSWYQIFIFFHNPPLPKVQSNKLLGMVLCKNRFLTSPFIGIPLTLQVSKSLLGPTLHSVKRDVTVSVAAVQCYFIF